MYNGLENVRHPVKKAAFINDITGLVGKSLVSVIVTKSVCAFSYYVEPCDIGDGRGGGELKFHDNPVTSFMETALVNSSICSNILLCACPNR